MSRYIVAGSTVSVALSVIMLTPASATTLSSQDATTFQNCKGMSVDEAFRDKRCRVVLRKLHVSKRDLAKMQSCESQASDTDCREMAEKHPDLARGHGMDDSSNGP